MTEPIKITAGCVSVLRCVIDDFSGKIERTPEMTVGQIIANKLKRNAGSVAEDMRTLFTAGFLEPVRGVPRVIVCAMSTDAGVEHLIQRDAKQHESRRDEVHPPVCRTRCAAADFDKYPLGSWDRVSQTTQEREGAAVGASS